MKNKLYYKGKYARYKGRFLIAFYDKTGEHFINIFDNVRQLLQYKNIEITRKNVMIYSKCIYYAIAHNNHNTRLLNGKSMTVWLVDEKEDSDDIEMKGD